MKVHLADAALTQASAAVPAQEDGGAAARSGAGGPVDRTELSRLGALLGALDDLRARDPSRYQRAVESLSSRLEEAAPAQPRGEAELFGALARRLRQGSGAPAQPTAGRAAAYAPDTARSPSSLEDLVEASLQESAA
jgi:hypothetical protein